MLEIHHFVKDLFESYNMMNLRLSNRSDFGFYKWLTHSLFSWLVAAGGYSIQCTYPWTDNVKGVSIKQTPLNLYKEYISSQISQQWSNNLCSFWFKAQQPIIYTRVLYDLTQNFESCTKLKVFLCSLSMASIPFASEGGPNWPIRNQAAKHVT